MVKQTRMRYLKGLSPILVHKSEGSVHADMTAHSTLPSLVSMQPP
jgi:hypothetical protein